ncbi:ArpU family phage packaging/lysis transcriptional regulator [Macrococcoides caseolyticum]|uniref:ArpU family transcriptional regulator n=2 Tax=Staphylococcaceae TaxID=90964 RepID=A0ACC9MPS7_9STAP|nr:MULTISPECIES: ArpU family phage packaging/lysis transcriptional regulator [Macrococcus]MDJ1090708.1 ArpU family phage packaging/lysis transcriptional regulator [Macrococcus caseolyticus]PKE17778.1 ArpU family transcriptional regulator [Macrococcus caseolyticus]PKE38509.1 ArpU family transcriptional regulator [Macrococcus caseolyticus]PKE51617.1 ArpU family transcriptional regulator [Macrococcus caseolyticus]PKE55668.1 ArpU family transcriptional regulator [Macrococcus caseolyticus]
MTLLLEIKNLDFIKTRKNVYKLFNKYNRLLCLMPVRSYPSVTQSFSLEPPTTVKDLNKIELSVSKNIEREQMMLERQQLMDNLHNAIDNLKPDEKYIIVNKYLQEERGIDIDIYTELGIGKTKYYEIKNDAIIRLAFYLGMEEYSEVTE